MLELTALSSKNCRAIATSLNFCASHGSTARFLKPQHMCRCVTRDIWDDATYLEGDIACFVFNEQSSHILTHHIGQLYTVRNKQKECYNASAWLSSSTRVQPSERKWTKYICLWDTSNHTVVLLWHKMATVSDIGCTSLLQCLIWSSTPHETIK